MPTLSKNAPGTLFERLRQSMSGRFIRFIAVSGFAAVMNFIARIIINRWTTYAVAVVLAYLVGMAVAFMLNRMFVFERTDRSVKHQVVWFTLVNVLAIVQTLVVSVAFAQHIFPMVQFRWHAEALAHVIGMGAPIVSSYFGHKHLSFRSSSR